MTGLPQNEKTIRICCPPLCAVLREAKKNVKLGKKEAGLKMTELETMQRAKMYLDKLAQGINPITDEEVPEDSVLNNVRLARCFFYVSGVLDQLIANGGKVNKSAKGDFYITEEELRRVKPTQEPILISQFLELVMNAIGDTERKRLSHTTITNWLILKGFLQKQEGPDGKSKRLPTPAGEQLGLTVRTREGQYGTYQAVYYSQDAQQFLLDHLQDILHPGK